MNKRKRKPLSLPPSQAVASKALSDAVNLRCSGSALNKSGVTARARKLRDDCGLDRKDAALLASQTGKGHTAEVHQAATYSANSGSRSRRHRARPNPKTNDPVIDVQVLSGTRVTGGCQVKVGKDKYVERAITSGKYPLPLVANVEACEGLWKNGLTPIEVDDRMRMYGGEALQLREREVIGISAHALLRAMQNRRGLERLDELLIMAKAGLSEGLTNFLLVAAHELSKARTRSEISRALEEAFSAGCRSASRATLQAAYLVFRFDAKARAQFSAGLVHRIASQSVAAGECAEVIVETILDLVTVRRGQMDMAEFWSNLGIQTCRAAGGAGGALLLARLTRVAPWWIQGGAMLVGQIAGREIGAWMGEALFGQPEA